MRRITILYMLDLTFKKQNSRATLYIRCHFIQKRDHQDLLIACKPDCQWNTFLVLNSGKSINNIANNIVNNITVIRGNILLARSKGAI